VLALFGGFCVPASALAAGTRSAVNKLIPATPSPPSSNPYDVTTEVAIAQAVHPVYRAPSTHAGKLHMLQLSTPDGEALQTYRLLASEVVKGVRWEQIAVPMRPNGSTGWVKRSWLGQPIISHTLMVVNRAERSLTVYHNGAAIYTAPVGVGKPSTPTPPGHFWIAESFASSDPFYGPWAFGTTDYATITDWADGGMVGVHGTNEPSLIPGDPSHGCVRMLDADVLKLKTMIAIGSAIWIE
jgi:lipoprotein-anchoring transpeptidase ErfK/SrfK